MLSHGGWETACRHAAEANERCACACHPRGCTSRERRGRPAELRTLSRRVPFGPLREHDILRGLWAAAMRMQVVLSVPSGT